MIKNYPLISALDYAYPFFRLEKEKPLARPGYFSYSKKDLHLKTNLS